ncbi:hypothetical protein ACN20G_00970 [Streptomyces sp. BI20]|uniref:hypothetical protein n=1 Tax=Streptomyces sp. BI20 TaxID=3403460 RepID=UPI003C718B87
MDTYERPVPPPPLSPPELLGIVRDIARDLNLWRGRLAHAAEEAGRHWVPVFHSDHVGVWAMDWSRLPAGSDGGLEHRDARGAVWVAQGLLRHLRTGPALTPVASTLAEGDGFWFDESCRHRMRPDPSAGPTLTLHAFSPAAAQTPPLLP